MTISIPATATANGGGASSVLFPTTAIGTAAADRLVLVVVYNVDAGSSGNFVAGVTIGATSTAPLGDVNDGFNTTELVTYWANIPTGVVANITVNLQGSSSNSVGIIVYAVTGANTTTPQSSVATASAGGTSVNTPITILSGGVLLACAASVASGQSFSAWTNATADQNNSYPVASITGALSTGLSSTAGTPTVTAAFTQSALTTTLLSLIALQSNGTAHQQVIAVVQGQAVALVEHRGHGLAVTSPQVVALLKAANKSIAVHSGQVIKLARAIQKLISWSSAQVVAPNPGLLHNVVTTILQPQAVSLIARFAKLKSIVIAQAQAVSLVRSINRRLHQILTITQGQSVTLVTIKDFATAIGRVLANGIHRVRTLKNKIKRVRTMQNANSRRKP